MAASFAILKRRALLLGTANALDYAIQFLLPVVLVRTLDADAFGQYRVLWLAALTVMAVVPLSVPQSLYYFLPRSDAATKRLYVHQTLIYLAIAALVGGLAMNPWNPLLPPSMRSLGEFGLLVPCLIALWVVANLLDLLPTIEERIAWQAGVTISLSLLRALTLASAAWLTGDLGILIWLLLALALFKLLVLAVYVARTHGFGRPWLSWRPFVGQLRQAVPFGGSAALYGLRAQADQWVAASLFTLQNFASFSIAAVIGPVVNLFRLSVNHVFLPSMSRLEAEGDMRGMLELNSRANVIVAALAYPLLAFAFVFAEEMVTLIYTAAYVEAAPVMRVYIVGLAAMVVELVSITLLLKEGAFALRLNVAVLALSIALSWLAALQFGLAGAAVGSVLAIYLDRIMTLKRIALRTGIPLRNLQDWRSLALLLLFATLGAAVAWALTTRYFLLSGPPVRLMVGAALVAAGYALVTALFGRRLGWPGAAWMPRDHPAPPS